MSTSSPVVLRVIGGSASTIPSGAINTTSRSRNWSRELSPFFLPGGHLYGVYYGVNVENSWQFSKVYRKFLDTDGNPSPAYFTWARTGWESQRAERYPVGRGAVPEYSWWDGEKLSYVEARRKIYIPLYARAAVKTAAYRRLVEMRDAGEDIVLWDFDGYDNQHPRINLSYEEVLDCPARKMGHAFVIAMLLTGKITVDANDSIIIHPEPEKIDVQENLF